MNTFNSSLLPTPDELQQWHVLKDAHGPTFAGSPSWKSYLSFLEERLVNCGLIGLGKDAISYNRWHTATEREQKRWTLVVEGHEMFVASFWPNSGATPASGVTAPLVYYDDAHPPRTLEGKIAVMEIPPLPEPLPPEFDVYAGFEYVTDDGTHPTDTFSLRQWYNIAYPALLGGFNDILKEGNAAGGLVISDMGPARASGVYMMPYETSTGFAPALYLDRETGRAVKEAAREVKTATLTLVAQQEESEAFFLSGFLPGRKYGHHEDEMVLLITHTDGPSLTQENGALGVVALIQYFSQIPREERLRTLLVVLDPQHYMPGRHAVDWFKLHPEAAGKIVASMGVEHLGQREYREEGDSFSPTGRPEVTRLFVQDNDRLIRKAIQAVNEQQLPRTYVHCPPRSGGRWEAMGSVALEREIPGYGLSADMGAHWSFETGVGAFDKLLAWRQIAVAAQLTGELMCAPGDAIAVAGSDAKNLSYGFQIEGK